MIQLLELGIRRGVERGAADVVDSRHAAQYMYFGCKGVTEKTLLGPGDIDRDRLVGASQWITRKILQP